MVEANKEVVLMQSVAGKHMGRAFHYDKVQDVPALTLHTKPVVEWLTFSMPDVVVITFAGVWA